MEDDFTAQAQRFVRSAVYCAVPLGLAFGESCFWGVGFLDVAVPLGFVFQGVASKLCFREKSQLKWRFWWMGVCPERIEIIPNVHSLAGTKMRDRQIWGVNLPPAFVCLEPERGVSIAGITRTVHTLGRP